VLDRDSPVVDGFPPMNFANIGLLFAASVASVIGQFFLKTGAKEFGAVNLGSVQSIVSSIFQILFIPQIMGGILSYAIGLFAYIFALSRMPISIVSPSIAMSYVFAVLMGKFIFGEDVPVTRYVGMGLIVCGVIFIMKDKTPT
jgi:drug/metabolite transporter (DMT)-like permease